ncbi:MAG: MBL fold metallo-hydrolase [bacterium]|nr:MBL fold metallo-hydrolase [bacterium]
MRRSVQVKGAAILVLLALTLCIWYAAIQEDRHGKLTVSFLDVGQGDAIFIEAPSGRQALIDGGKGTSVLRQLSSVVPWYDKSIDVVVGTHPDQDHIGGLVEVLRRYRAPFILESSVLDTKGADSKAFEKAISEEEDAKVLEAKRGTIIDLGDGAYIEILFPDRALPSVETNTGSIVTRIVYGDTAFMLTGDSPDEIENYLVTLDGEKLKSNVLKAGHHGSKTSSAPLFVGFVAPEYAVFSRGCNNSYGHPAPETVATFARFGIPTLDTCNEGTITFVSDGKTVVRK